MNRLLKGISSFNHKLCKALMNLTGTILCALSIILFVSVIMRYSFNSPVTWSEDIAKILMVWMVLLGAPVGLRRGSHVAIDMLLVSFPPLLRKLITILNLIIIIFVAWIFLKFGWSFAIKGMRRIVPSVAWLKFGYAYLSLPVGYGLMFPVLLEQIISHFVCLGKNNTINEGVA